MRRYTVTVAGQKKVVELEEREGEVHARLDGDAEARRLLVRGGEGRYLWRDGDRVVTAEVERAGGGKLAVNLRGASLVVEIEAAEVEVPALVGAAGKAAGPVVVRAPMPGRVVKVLVKVGEEVKAGAGLVVVEAMKMENEIKSPRAARVKALKVSEGAAVEGGEELALLE